MKRLKAPFPYFGGKSAVAPLVWERLGDVDNYIEPFMGSAAVLLARPTAPRVETVNDLDCYVANFWRATSHDPESVAAHADWPVNEADLHARHRRMVLGEEAAAFRERVRADPDYFDPRLAGWWCWGLCCWIGGGWCAVPGETAAEIGAGQQRRPVIAAPHSQAGLGVHGKGPPKRRPRVPGGFGSLPGVNGKAKKTCEWDQPPSAADRRAPGTGVNGVCRPQLADAYARGRGVHGNDDAGTCGQRLAWLIDWFGRLRDRLRAVRVCCGHWLRVCDSESVTTRLGLTGVFLDPPYSKEAGRDMGIYATESGVVAQEVRAWCLERGGDVGMRIALCGYAGEGHEELERRGWSVVPWKAQGGYGNRTKKGKANAAKERLWFSPHCDSGRTLFDGLGDPR